MISVVTESKFRWGLFAISIELLLLNKIVFSGEVQAGPGAAGPQQGDSEWRREVRDHGGVHDGAPGAHAGSLQMCRRDQPRWGTTMATTLN